MSTIPDMTAVWKARPDNPAYEEMRTRLMDAAEELIRREGAAALRLDDVAADAGCHRSSVYRYFESKEDLIAAVLVRRALLLSREVIAGLEDVDDPAEHLVEGIIRSLHAIRHDPSYRSLTQPSYSVAVNRVGARVVSEAIQPLLLPLLEASGGRGGLRRGVSIEDATRWLVIVVAGLITRRELLDSEEDLRLLLHRMLVPVILRRR